MKTHAADAFQATTHVAKSKKPRDPPGWWRCQPPPALDRCLIRSNHAAVEAGGAVTT